MLIAHFLVSPDELMLVCDIHGIYASFGISCAWYLCFWYRFRDVLVDKSGDIVFAEQGFSDRLQAAIKKTMEK